MDTQTIQEIRKVKATINRVMDHEGQDAQLVVEMAEEMLTDLEANGSLVELSYYIKRYCDVLDNPDDEATELAAEIETMLQTVEGDQIAPCRYTQSHTRDWCGNPGCREG